MKVAIAVLLCATCAIAVAEDRPAARKAFRTADRAYKAQNFDAAAHHYEEAYKHLPLPEIAFSAAQAYRKQYRVESKVEHVVRAIELYEVYLSKVKTGGRVGDAADNLGEMKRELLQLQARGLVIVPATASPPRTRLAISPDAGSQQHADLIEVTELRDPGAPKFVVTIDGKTVPAYVPIDVAPGPHVVRVEAPGYISSETNERAIESLSRVVEIALVPQPGRVKLATEPGAEIMIDGRARGTAPIGDFELPAGTHVLAISRRGRRAVAREITLERGATLALRQPLEPTKQRRAVRWVAIGAGVFAVVSLGSAIYANVQDGRAEDHRATLDRGDGSIEIADRYDATIRSRDRFSATAWITGGAAIAAGLAAAGLYWFDSPKPERLQIAPTGAGVSVSGRF